MNNISEYTLRKERPMGASKNNRLTKLVEMMRFISDIAFTNVSDQKHAIDAWNSRKKGETK